MPTTITGASGKVTAVASLLGAAVLAFIAYKLLMGVIRVGVILLIIGALCALYSTGVIG
jgi:hypothetical protein